MNLNLNQLKSKLSTFQRQSLSTAGKLLVNSKRKVFSRRWVIALNLISLFLKNLFLVDQIKILYLDVTTTVLPIPHNDAVVEAASTTASRFDLPGTINTLFECIQSL